MTRKLCYFIAASVFVGFFLIRGGAPPLAIVLGILGAGLVAFRTSLFST